MINNKIKKAKNQWTEEIQIRLAECLRECYVSIKQKGSIKLQ